MIIKKGSKIVLSLLLVGFIGGIYVLLEQFSHTDFGCGCSSACTSFFPTNTSKNIGYILMVGSLMGIIYSLFKPNKKVLIPLILVFVSAFYANGYYLFDKGLCGFSLNRASFFILHTKIGDFAKSDGEIIIMDSLKAGKYNGELLGYAVKSDRIKIFRIGEDPVDVRTKFLYWEINDSLIIQDIATTLSSYRNIESEENRDYYEFVGGEGMSEKDFMNEFVLTNNDYFLRHKLKNKSIVNEKDGTTRFRFQVEKK